MSTFDPETFLDATTTEAGTRRPPLPPGDYIATIGELKAQGGQQKQDPSKSWFALNTPLEVDLTAHSAARAIVGQDKVVLFDFVMIDVTAGGGLDWSPGRNRRLTAYREATNLNRSGESFNPRMLQGRQVLAKVGQEVYNGELRDVVQMVAKVA